VSWRPTPAERNPLLALRRVVETPDGETGGTAVRLEPVPGVAGPPTAARSHRRAHERVARHSIPERPVRALITSTPIDTPCKTRITFR